MTIKVSIDRTELLRLRLYERVAPIVHSRRLHPAVAYDLTRRMVESGKFNVGISGELTGDDVQAFISDVEASASHLFQSDVDGAAATDDRAARQSDTDRIANLPAYERLKLANARKFAEDRSS